MIAKTNLFVDMANWVSQRKAAEITGLDRTCIWKNAMKGRLTFRVKDGTVFIFEPAVRGFHGAPFGNPDRTSVSDNGLRPHMVKEFKKLREQIESTYSDVAYEVDLDDTSAQVRVTVFDQKGTKTLKPQKLKRAS